MNRRADLSNYRKTSCGVITVTADLPPYSDGEGAGPALLEAVRKKLGSLRIELDSDSKVVSNGLGKYLIEDTANNCTYTCTYIEVREGEGARHFDFHLQRN